MTSITSIRRPNLSYDSIDQAFPQADPGLIPFGSRVLVQKRSAREVTKGGIIVPHETQETEFWNTQVAKVITLGPGAFKNRDSLETWPEGEWCEVGTYVRVPKYGGDRWDVDLSDEVRQQTGADKACFALFNDLDLIGQITCDPLEVVAYL
jgi:Co-chaperonin GroES (HSP10)|tara:strand:- start:142 stop:594 length:453 start_codon:yes stop_codon:yes gene_type:complete